MSHLKEKVILITGGTSGIGEACTESFARHGAKVVAMSIQAEEGKALAARLTGEGLDCEFHFGDVSEEPAVKAAVDLALSRFGRLDCVLSNAGMMRTARIPDLTVADFQAMINVNLLGPVLVAKHAIPVMERQGKGVICFTTSVAADIGFPGHGIYCASKAALVALIRCLTTDHSPKGIRFVGVSPGTIDTPMLAASCAGWSKSKEEIYADVAKKIPVQRMGKPIDVANAVGFLMTDDAGFINGSIVQLEGGTLCLPPW
ncbi:MAG: SDR family oxidoreductase [Patescibacteria group bacterium]|nr:SDR family oxidoreductase [Patescibacteria group bacterium]